MTNEIAIKLLNEIRKSAILRDGEIVAIKMAIKALEQKPCNTDTCKVVKAYMNGWDKPITTEPKTGYWISVSERLPEDCELVLFSTKTDRVFEGRYFADNTDRQWYAFRDETFAWNNVVTAWMPLPEPYKESEGV